MLRTALGADYKPLASATPATTATTASTAKPTSGSGRDAVFSVVARLLMSPDWPKIVSDQTAVAHAVSQLLAGIGSVVCPAKTWRGHTYWGKFRDLGDFDVLKEFVEAALTRPVKCGHTLWQRVLELQCERSRQKTQPVTQLERTQLE